METLSSLTREEMKHIMAGAGGAGYQYLCPGPSSMCGGPAPCECWCPDLEGNFDGCYPEDPNSLCGFPVPGPYDCECSCAAACGVHPSFCPT